MIWDILYQITGIGLMVVVSIFVYKFFIESKRDKMGIPVRT